MNQLIHTSFFANVLSLEDTLTKLSPFFYKPLLDNGESNLTFSLIEPIIENRVEEKEMELKEEIESKEEIVTKVEEPKCLPPNRHFPKLFFADKEDTLFWAIYIHVYGYGAYLEIGSKYKNVEIAEKQKIMTHLKANAASTYKTGTPYKLTNIEIQEIMSDLMTNRKTSLLTIYALCVYYKMPILLVKEMGANGHSMYHEFMPNGPDVVEDNCIIYYRYGKYGIYLTEDAPHFYKEDHFRLETIYKPLRAVSSYKLPELEGIFDTVVKPTLSETELCQKRKKGDIYQAIIEKCVW